MIGLQALGGMVEANQKDRIGLEQVGATRFATDASRYNSEQKAMADQYDTQQRSAIEASKQRYERGRNREQDYWNIADKKSQIEERGLPKPPNAGQQQAEIVALYRQAMERIGTDPNAEKAAAFYLKMYNDLGFNKKPQDGALTVQERR